MNLVSILLLLPFVAAQPADNLLQQPLRVHATNTTLAGDFSYTGVTGPLGWAGLSAGNAKCSIGRLQSPINLDDSIASAARNPSVSIPDGYTDLTNNGHTVQAPARGTTVFNGKTYSLQQFHFHTPSEHRVYEEYYPLEVHFVHQAQGEGFQVIYVAYISDETTFFMCCIDGSLLVLGAFFEVTANGFSTAFISRLASEMHLLSRPGSVTRVYDLSARDLVDYWHKDRLFQYTGSLTTPPCSEGVTWLVAQHPLSMDAASYLAFKRVLKFNARYTQNSPGEKNLIEVAASQLPR